MLAVVVVWSMIPDGWLDGGRCGEGAEEEGSSGYDEVWYALCVCGTVHMVMRHVRASMMYRSLASVCIIHDGWMFIGCGVLEAGEGGST